MPTIKGVRQAGELSGAIELADNRVVRRYSLEYVVIADDTAQGPVTIRSTAGLPSVGVSSYSYSGDTDSQAICKRKTPKRDRKQPRVWYVTCEFDNDASNNTENEDDGPVNPLDRPYEVEWTSEYQDVVMEKDYSDPPKPVVNPVGHKFDPPPTRRRIIPVVTIMRFESSFTADTKFDYEDHTNETSFLGADAGCALMTRIDAKRVIEEGTAYWQVTYRVAFNKDGWDLELLNQGSHYSESAYGPSAELKPFIKGQVPYVGNLNANGTRAAEGTRTYSNFKGHPRADFDALGLD